MTFQIAREPRSSAASFVLVRRAMLLAAACGVVSFAAGCDDDAPDSELSLTTPAAGATLTMAEDDEDLDRAGLQLDLVGASKGIRAGTTVNWFLDGEKQEAAGKVGGDGSITVAGVTLPPGTHHLYLQTSTNSATSDKEQAYTLRAVVIASPENGATLTNADDKDDKESGVQIDVTVDGFALEKDEKIGLRLDGEDVGDAIAPDKDGQAVFEGVTLISGNHTLVAYVGTDDVALESGEVRVEVQEECVALTFTSPEAPSGDKLTLGGDDCPNATDKPFTTDVSISTDAGNGRKAQLIVNGRAVASAVIEGAVAKFKDVVLSNRRDTPNTIAVSVENSDGVTCHKDFPAEVFVDCAGASCSITTPKPASYVDDKGDLTLFLNRSLLVDGDSGFDVAVQTDKDVAGQKVKLVIDGRDSDALETKSAADGDTATAAFTAVSLSEGSHSIEALCSDDSGNVSSSGELTWVVDTTACGVDITDPAKDALFVPGNDEDDDEDGVQVPVSADIDGKDCSAQRAAVCTPSTGIKGPQFADFNGKSPLVTSVTLDSDASDQTLCVEVEDHAGNLGRDDVAVTFRNTEPKIAIESPADGAKFNAAGGTGYTKDADTDTSACDAEVSIACSELGVEVQLRRDAADGDVIATGTCEKPGSGDPDLPDGYFGRALITAPVFDDESSVTLVATQAAPGSGSATIGGKSTAITIEGDCEKPDLSFDNDPCAEDAANSQLTLVQASSRDVEVNDETGDIEDIELVFANTDEDETEGMPAPDSFDDESATFSNLDLGAEGEVTITVTATDDFGNSAELSCTATIVGDLPVIETFTSPEDDATYGFGTDAIASCSTGTPGEFGVRVQATADKEEDRVFTITVNGDEVANGDVGDNGEIDECVPVPDNTENDDAAPSILVLRVDSTAMGGFDDADRTVNVHKLSVTNAPQAPLQAAQNCAGVGFGYSFMVNVDPSLGNPEFTFTSGAGSVGGTASNGTITACVPLEEGANTVVLTIDGTDISYEIEADVVTAAPDGIVIKDQPTPDPDNPDPDYRDGALAAWERPAQAFTGQLTDYHLRCQATELLEAASDPTKDAWWTAAAPDIVLPNALTPDSNNPSVRVPGRPEEPNHCVVRVENVAGLLSPIIQSTDMKLKLRQVVVSTGTAASWDGVAVAAVGDVDGDGVQDMLLGGRGRAELVFGTTGNPEDANRVLFVSTVTNGAGRSVAGIGDFNGDELDDFAIGDQLWNANAGRVSIFFGRPQGEWPDESINIDTTCNADLCLEGTGTPSIGRALQALGNFDAVGNADFAIGSSASPTGAQPYNGLLVVVLGDDYAATACTTDADCLANANCPDGGGSCELDAGETFWKLQFDVSNGNWSNPPSGGPVARLNGFRLAGSGALANSQFGFAIASLGEFDGVTGDDLAVSANRVGQIHYLSGRTHTGPTGFNTLTVSDLGLPGQAGGSPIATGSAASFFGTTLARLGDFYDPPSSSGVLDLAIGSSATDSFSVQPGEGTPAFSAPAVSVQGAGTNVGYSLASSVNAIQGIVGDLDGDDRGELLAGTRLGATRDIMLWYADAFATSVSGGVVQKSTGLSVPLAAAATGSGENFVQYVGDVNGDGHVDILVGDPRVNTNQGQVILLY